ncbi:MAG: DUF4920 domain-containing protein [Bacteroidota bacterium]
MLKKLTFLFPLLFSVVVCLAQDGQQFGAPITSDNAMKYDKLIKKMKKSDSLSVKVVGTVEAVCQMKGCWMNIVSDKADKPPMMVKFKDYGFFVPKDIAGRKVIMEGYAYKEVTPVDELRHYAEDAGKSKEEIQAINEPKKEYKFMATGVLLLEE